MKSLLASCFVLLTLSACASSYDDQRDARSSERRDRYEGQRAMARRGNNASLLPPDRWWRDPQIAGALELTAAQSASLDTISEKQQTAIDTLRSDGVAATRDLRLLLAADHTPQDTISAASQHLRTLRDDLLNHELTMLADERQVLTQAQWSSLQTSLAEEGDRTGREGRDRNSGRGGFGRGRGGFGGGGRRPGAF